MQKVQVRIMNKVILMGRLTRDPEMRNSNGESNTAIARYTLAVDRRYKREGEAGESQSGAGDRVALDKICEQRHRVLYVVCVRVRLRLQQPRSEQFSLRPGLCHRSESNQIISARHAGHRISKGAGR